MRWLRHLPLGPLVVVFASVAGCRGRSTATMTAAPVSPSPHAQSAPLAKLTRAETTSPSTPSEVACAGCHPAETDEWRSSMHHAAFTSADFQRSFRVEPRAYCAACHAPLRTSVGTRDGDAGIGCVACHTVDKGHLASGTHARAPVATKECKTCHDFDVPGTRAILQSTAREQSETAFASSPCTQCHMQKRENTRRDHRFGVTRNRELLGRALRVYPAHVEPGAVVVAIASSGVGHRFPTGDIYRRLTATLTAFTKDDAVIGGATFHFNRDWDKHRASLSGERPEAMGVDTRLTAQPHELRIDCAQPPARVHLTIEYERGAGADGDLFEAFETLEIFDRDLDL